MATKKDYIAEIRKYPESKFAKLADSTLNSKTIAILTEELIRLNVDLTKFEGSKKETKSVKKKNAEVVLEMTDESLAYGLTYSNAHYLTYNETKDPDIFERIIDETMLEVALNNSFTIPHKNGEDITYIFGTPEHKDVSEKIRAKIADPKYRAGKRKLITKLLNSTNPFYGKLELLLDKQKENNIGKYEFLKELVYLLREYLGIHKGSKADKFKKSHGEVTTPLELVEEMLDTLPKDVWINPNLKWLDPANGCGAFPCIVILRLMEGLQNFEGDEDLRFKHILEKMIYICEIQPTNMYLYLFCVDAEDKIKNNIYCGSFLSEEFDRHMREVWNVDKFDIIIGNPPYNDSNDGKNNKTKNLYNIFIEKSMKISNQILMITPSRWLGIKNMEMLRNNILSYGLRFVKIFNKDVFNEASIDGGVCFFLLEKNFIKETQIISENVNAFAKFNLNDKIIINSNPKLTLSILSKIDKFNKLSFLYKNPQRIKSNDPRLKDSGEYKVLKSKNIIKFIDHETSPAYFSDKLRVIFERVNGGFKKTGINGLKILEKNILTTQSISFFPVNSTNEGESLISYLKTKIVFFLRDINQFDKNFTSHVFEYVPIVPFDREWTDEKLFEYFDLSEEEKNLVLAL